MDMTKEKKIVRRSGKSILLADDNQHIRQSLTELLIDNGYLVETVENGSRAYEQTLKNNYDLVILDISMPKMNGVEAVSAIREKKSDLPILIISGRASPRELYMAIKNGAIMFIGKPFTFDELLSNIRNVLEVSKQPIKQGLKLSYTR